MKVCSCCGEEKPDNAFHRIKKTRLYPYCKPCRSKKAAAAYREKHPEAAETRYCRDCKTVVTPQGGRCKDCRREYKRQKARKWREDNPERARETQRRKWASDPERYAGYVRDGIRRRRARLLEQFVADVTEKDIIVRDQGLCGICGKQITGPMELDHILPLAQNGTHEPDNIQLAHPACNKRKGARVNFTLDA